MIFCEEDFPPTFGCLGSGVVKLAADSFRFSISYISDISAFIDDNGAKTVIGDSKGFFDNNLQAGHTILICNLFIFVFCKFDALKLNCISNYC